MKKIYDIGKIEIGKFVDRPNRFIAEIEIDNKVEKCHVHDSGRIRELLFQGNEVGVKGVSLSEDKVAKFPDAPSTRACKHLKELIKLKESGDRAAVMLLVFRDSDKFRPKYETDEEFSKLFYEAKSKGVEIYPIQLRLEDGAIYYIEKKIEII